MRTLLLAFVFTAFRLAPGSPGKRKCSACSSSFGGEPRGIFGVQTGSLDSFDSTDFLASPAYGWEAGAYAA